MTTLLVILAETSYLAFRMSRKTTTNKGDILLDTSVLIDGRILAIARSGLVSSRLIVTRSVIRELQFMADKADHDKRERARYGLEVIEKLQELPNTSIVVSEDGEVSEHGVDEQLINVAQKSGAKLCTIDYNLNKAARVQAVEIVNINELAHALRVVHLPGEKINVQLVQPGQDKKQAVGYLDDGTMVVVDDSRELIGQSVPVELTRVLQTTAGKMMFARRTSIVTEKKVHTLQKHKNEKSQDVAFRNDFIQNTNETDAGSRQSPARRPRVTNLPNEKAPASSEQTAKNRTTRRQRPKQKRTPEDKLVDLANN